MKQKLSILLFLLLACTFIVTGCSDDDDDNPASAGSSTTAVVYGRANLYPTVDFSVDFMFTTNPHIFCDSAIAFDSLCWMSDEYYWYVYGDNNYGYVEYDPSVDTGRYHSGDTMTATFYYNGAVVTTDIKLLSYYDDIPQSILPVSGDTVSLGSAINLIWNSVENADWYGMYTRYRKDSAGTQVYTYKYHSTTDTTLSIPGATNIYNGYYDIYLIAVSGPGPNEPLNLEGGGMRGEIHSYTTYDSNIRVYFGTGDPTPVSGGSDEPIVEEEVPNEIMNHFFHFGPSKSYTDIENR